jgi:RNA polymerase sigma-70 factor (ECF subfamily)
VHIQKQLNTYLRGGVLLSEGEHRVMSALVERLNPMTATGEPDAEFALRVRESRALVFRIAYSVLANAADAEEVAQDAFLQAHRRMNSLRDVEKFRAWVSRIVFRLALNRVRERGRRLNRDTAWQEMQPQVVADREQAGADREYLERLRGEIERMPEKLRAVVLLGSVAGMDATEVAKVLKIPAGTVRSRLHLARKMLLEVMER